MNLSELWSLLYQGRGGRPVWKTVSAIDGSGIILLTDGKIAKNLSQFQLKEGDKVLVHGGNILQLDWRPQIYVPVLFPQQGFYIIVADTANHRIQVFDENYTFIRKWGSYGDARWTATEAGQFRFPFGVATYNSEIFVTNKEQGWIEVFDIDGNWKRGHFANAYVLHIAVSDDKIAVVLEDASYINRRVNIYDMDFNLLYTFEADTISEPGKEIIASGIAIGDGMFFSPMFTTGLEPRAIRVYALDYYTLITTMERPTGHKIYDGGAFYGGKFYGLVLDPQPAPYQSEIDVFEGLTYSHSFGADRFQPSGVYGGARGIAASARGIFATEVRSGAITVPDEDRILHFEESESYKGTFGVSGGEDGHLYQPWSIAIMEKKGV
jgi:hypothetical protein